MATRDQSDDLRIEWPAWSPSRRRVVGHVRSLRTHAVFWFCLHLLTLTAAYAIVALPVLLAAWFFWPSYAFRFPPPTTGHLFSFLLPGAAFLLGGSMLATAFLAVAAICSVLLGARRYPGYFGAGRSLRRWRTAWMSFERAVQTWADTVTSGAAGQESWLPPPCPIAGTYRLDAMKSVSYDLLSPQLAVRRGGPLEETARRLLAQELGAWTLGQPAVTGRWGNDFVHIRMPSDDDLRRRQYWSIFRIVDSGRQVVLQVETGFVWWAEGGHMLDGSYCRSDLSLSRSTLRRSPFPGHIPFPTMPFLWLFPLFAFRVSFSLLARELWSFRSFVGQFLAFWQMRAGDFADAMAMSGLRAARQALHPYEARPMFLEDLPELQAFRKQILDVVHAVSRRLEATVEEPVEY